MNILWLLVTFKLLKQISFLVIKQYFKFYFHAI